MTVRVTGVWCRRCKRAPVWMDGLCSGCWRLLGTRGRFQHELNAWLEWLDG
jgi:hypothetical protein